jgi:hypothetical protein
LGVVVCDTDVDGAGRPRFVPFSGGSPGALCTVERPLGAGDAHDLVGDLLRSGDEIDAAAGNGTPQHAGLDGGTQLLGDRDTRPP